MGTTYWFFRCKQCNEFEAKVLLTDGDKAIVVDGYVTVSSDSIAVVVDDVESYEYDIEGVKCASCGYKIHNDIEENLDEISLAF